MKQLNLFFEGEISTFFNNKKDLYLGDLDFKFADDYVSIIAEIKTISKNNEFTGKKLSVNQAREYCAMNNVKDNLGRIQKTFLFEYHKHTKEPYVIVVPFKNHSNKIQECLNLEKAICLYIKKENQFNRWISGDRYVGFPMQKPLLCI